MLVLLYFFSHYFALIEGLVLPYEAVYPAKILYGMWTRWYEDPWMGGNDAKHLGVQEPCDVPEEVTLQWAYFKTIIADKTISTTKDEKYFSIISELATHIDFYKLKIYPFLPNTGHSRFCTYEKYGVKLVCHPTRKRCMDCVKMSNASNPVLYEACNPEVATANGLPAVSEGAEFFKTVKRWMRKMSETFSTRKSFGDLCTATDKQTLAMIRMQKLLPIMRGHDAKTQREWEDEWRVIEDKFEGDEKLFNMRQYLLDFDESDSNAEYCNPFGWSIEESRVKVLVCDGVDCVPCEAVTRTGKKEREYRWINSTYLKDACREMMVF